MAADTPDADLIGQLQALSHSWDPLFPGVVTFSEEASDLSVKVAFQWTNDETDQVRSNANENPTTKGGTHVEGFSRAAIAADRLPEFR